MWTFIAVLAGVVAALGATNAWWWLRWRRERSRGIRLEAEGRLAEGRLRLELERGQVGQEAVFNCMSEGLLVVGGDGRVRILNQALRRLFELNGDQRGRGLFEVLGRRELVELEERARAEGQVLGVELELPDPKERILEVNATTFADGTGEDGRWLRGVILVFHDVTRMKRLENTRREFVANVSHELRTPLGHIKGYVETLIDGARNDPTVALRFLQKIENHAERLRFLIEDLLTISQLESRQVVLHPKPGPLRPLVARVLDDFAARARDRAIVLNNQVPEDLRARADFDRMQQVFLNLIDNAIKYGRAGGSVTVGGACLGPAAEPRVELWVTDDGPGIPKEALDRVFERFYRVDAARSRDQGGTGLGLSIVKHIVQAHGGEVRAESEPGKGATFRFTLRGGGQDSLPT